MISNHNSHKSRRSGSVPLSVFLFIIVISTGGCSVFSPVGEFIGRRYENVVAYFNTYYNASTAFEEAETEVLQQQASLRAKDLPIKLGDIPSTAKTKFDLSIEKLSRLLTFYPTSKWVDRSLFMIGKAYFYKGDLVRGERKFRELITTNPGSDYVYIATLWLGRSLFEAKRFDETQKELTALIPRAYENGERKIGAEAGILLAQTFLQIADTNRAVSAYKSVIEQSQDPSSSADAQLALAEIMSVNGEPENVLKAFARVREFDPVYVTEYKSRLRFAQYMTKIGRTDEAIIELQYMLERPEFNEFGAQIKYWLAYTYQQTGNISEAYSRYIEIDTLYRGNDFAAQSYFQRGIIQRKDSGNYDEAKTMFEKARAENAQSPISQKAGEYAEHVKQYLILRSKIHRCDSLLGRYQSSLDSTSNVNNTSDSLVHDRETADVSMRSDTTGTPVTAQGIDIIKSDSLGVATPDSVDRHLLNDRVASKRDTTLKTKTVSLDTVNGLRLPTDTLAVKNDTTLKPKTASLDTVKILGERVEALYDLGSLLYLQIDEPDSALSIFQEVLRSSPSEVIAAGTLFTMGQIYRSTFKDRNALADSLADSIMVKYPKTKFAQEIRRQRGIPLIEVSEETDATTLLLDAEKSIADSTSETTIRKYRNVIEKYPNSEHSKKAHYAIGWLYENTYKNLDSAAAWYAALVKIHPSSIYATKVKGKVAEVAAEKRIKDSIATASEKALKKNPPPGSVQKPAQGDTAKKTVADTLSRHSPIPGFADSVSIPKIDSLSNRLGKQRPIDDDIERLRRPGRKFIKPDTLIHQQIDNDELTGHPGKRLNNPDSLLIPKLNTVPHDSSATTRSDSLEKEIPQVIDEKNTTERPGQQPARPDTTKD